MRRRTVLTTALTGSAAAFVAACTVTKNNGQITVTIDTAKIHADGSAIIAALTAMVTMPPVALALGANLAIATGALAAAQATLAEIDKETNGALNLTVDTTKVASLVHSLISDAQTVLSVIQPALPSIPGDLGTKVSTYIAAILTLIPFLQAAVDVTAAPKGRKLPMTEAQALFVATH